MKMTNNHKSSLAGYYGFTIVELLVVIVIIGILAAITIVSYTNFSKRAQESVFYADLSSSKKQFELYRVEHGEYPTGLSNNCPTGPTLPSPDTKYCIKSSSDASYSYDFDGSGSYTLTLSNSSYSYKITNTTSPDLAEAPITSGWKQVSSGTTHTCAIRYDNKAYCWGSNSYGELGNNSYGGSLVPVAVYTGGVLNGKTIKSISTGYNTCVVASDNKVYCWGRNNAGQLGNNSLVDSSVPVAVDTSGVLNGKTIKTVQVNNFHTCVIASDNNVYCWGYNYDGELGNNSGANSSVPVAVDISGSLNGKTVKSLTLGALDTCVIASDNNGYCWGDNSLGQLGNNVPSDSYTPTPIYTGGVLSGKTIKTIVAGDYHICAIASDSNAYCWGYNYHGQLGNGTITNSLVPSSVSVSGALNGLTVKAISGGTNFSCAVASNGQAYCWGYNDHSQLGSNSGNVYTPVAVNVSGLLNGKVLNSISSSKTGDMHTCAISSENKIYCWGYNYYGALGNNSVTESYIPVSVQDP